MAVRYDHEGTLIDLKGASWTLSDALPGCLVTGSTGAGKSSNAGKACQRKPRGSKPTQSPITEDPPSEGK